MQRQSHSPPREPGIGRLERDKGHTISTAGLDTVALCQSPSDLLRRHIASGRFRAGCGQIIRPIQYECSTVKLDLALQLETVT
jgi:hypothetical protein